jgi:exopolysaccharide biosynthesis polyprenyl glycosylphosphotransferase
VTLLGVHRFAPTPAAKLGLALDLGALSAAVIVATAGPLWERIALALCATAVYWVTSSVIRHYGETTERAFWEEVTLTVVIFLAVLTVVGIGSRLLHWPSVNLGLLTVVALPALVFLRLTLYALVRAQLRPPREVLIVGVGSLGRITGEDLLRGRSECYYLSWPGESLTHPVRGEYLGEAPELAAVLAAESFDEVYLCGLPSTHPRALQDAVAVCETFGMPFALPAYSVRLGRAEPVESKAVADGFLHYTCGKGLNDHRRLKRLLDIVASAAALWLLFPVLLLVSALVRLTSSGPVFFRQVRVGLRGRRFNMLKFRSMVQDAEAMRASLQQRNEQAGPVFKMRNDPRVTRVGRFIRRFSIDELPQLVNVLRGDMTLVGPRPPVPQEVAQYEPWQRRRLSVPPGLTCLWQVSGRNEIAFQDWMYLDLQYIDHWNLGQDINLLLKTVPAVVSGRGSH